MIKSDQNKLEITKSDKTTKTNENDQHKPEITKSNQNPTKTIKSDPKDRVISPKWTNLTKTNQK